MLARLTKMASTTLGKIAVVVLGLGALGAASFAIVESLHQGSLDDVNTVVCVDSETGQSFRHRMQMGELSPFLSPYTKHNTGYPAEVCYWNADGTLRKEPFPVLLNTYAGKAEPTFCPDCGRLVVGRNPAPRPGSKPPPTEADYRSYEGR